MKRWKYLLGTAILLCLVVTLMALPVFGAEVVKTGSCGDSATYTLDADGVLTISGRGLVDHFAFEFDDAIKKVVVEPGITSIGCQAFYNCTSLTSVTLPAGLNSIKSSAFMDCASLTSVMLPEGLNSIGISAFEDCASLTSVTLPEGLTSIENSVFFGCDSLTSITISEGLDYIENFAFYGCRSLTSVTLPEGLTRIGGGVFANCYDLDHLIFLGDLPTIEEDTFEGSSPTVYYVEGNSTWDDDGMQKYGGAPTYKPLGSPVELVVTVAEPYPYYFTGDQVEKRDVDATLVYDSGARSLLHPGMFKLTGGDLSSLGVKTLTVTAQGFRASVTVYVHNGGAIEVDPADWPESPHNYKNNTDDTQVLTVPGADQIQITFSGQTHVESGRDDLYIYDGDGTQVAAYTGDEAAGTTLTVQGDTVMIRLVTDGSGTDWGYALSHVEAMWMEHVYESEGGPCVICNGTYVCAHDHAEGVITAGPTCQAEGITSYTCADCGLVYQEPIPRKGHSYDVVTGICDMCGGNTPFSVEAPQMEYCYGSSQVKVKAQWTKVSGIDGYELYMSTDRDDLSSYERVKTVQDPNTLNYTKGGLTPGVTYYFRVCAYVIGEDGLTRVRSPLSNVKYCMPTVLWDAPYSNSDFRIRLRWEPVEGADGFQIWRKGEGEDYRVVKTLKDGGADAYSNVSLKAGGTYTYKMRAYFINEDGSKSYGAYSDEITVGVQPSKPKVTVVSTKAGRAQVSWEDLYGASAYQVWMSESPNSGFKIAKSIYDGDVTSYTKSGLVSGKTYYFKVRASVEIDGKKTFGAYSEVIAVTVK